MSENKLKVEYVPISDLLPFAGNPRKNDEQVGAVVKSIEAFGYTNPILARRENREVIAGHTRLKALQALGEKVAPVIYLDLDEANARTYALFDNKSVENVDWDLPKLADLFVELDQLNIDLSLTGFSEVEIDDIAPATFEPQAEEDAIPQDVEAVTKTGDLWLLGEHRVLCGDCTIKSNVGRLMGEQKADMVFTDPPYGIDYSGGRTQTDAKKNYGKIKGDNGKDITRFIQAVVQNDYKRDLYLCLSPINLKPLFEVISNYDGVIVWKKNQPGLGYQFIRRYCEFVFFITKRQKAKREKSEFDFWEIATDPKNEYQHGTQKPVQLSCRAIEFSSVSGDIIADWFLGSGSTLIACEKTGRKCYGMEIDEHYCDVIVKRWEDYTGEKSKLAKQK